MANELDRFNRVIRNLYTAQFEQQVPGSENRVHTTAGLYYTETIRTRTVNGLGMAIAEDQPDIWLRMNDQLLDLGARDGKYVDSADITRSWRDNKALLYDGGSPTWVATPRITEAASLSTTDADGAKSFTGTAVAGSYYLTSAAIPTVENFTVEFLLNITSAPTGTWTAGGLANSAWTAGLFIDRAGGAIQLRGKPDNLVGGTLIEGTTYHCMYVRDARGTCYLYVDGVEVNSAASASTNTYASAPWVIAAGDADLEFILDEVTLYRTALTPEQCATHYAAYANGGQAAGSGYAPIARYYEDLTFSGTSTIYDSSMICLSDKASYFSSVCDDTTMWFIARIRPYYVYSVGSDKTIFQWVDDASNLVKLTFDNATDSWLLQRLAAAAGATASIVSAHAIYDYITLAFKLSATEISLSVNGGAWTDVANTSIAGLTDLYFDLPMAGLTGMLWVAMGVGELTDEGLAAAHASGNADPELSLFGDPVLNGLSFLWYCRGVAHKSLGTWGESMYD